MKRGKKSSDGTESLTVVLPAEIASWIRSHPDGAAVFVEGVARRAMQGARPAEPTRPGEDCQASLKQIEARDPDAARRAAAFVRYPQLVEAVAKDLVTIDRAEQMAQDADARKR